MSNEIQLPARIVLEGEVVSPRAVLIVVDDVEFRQALERYMDTLVAMALVSDGEGSVEIAVPEIVFWHDQLPSADWGDSDVVDLTPNVRCLGDDTIP